MIRYHPLNDFIFKKVFSNNKHLLIKLLNTIVSEEDQIDDLEVIHPELSGYNLSERLAILDLTAKSKIGKQYSIEIQIRPQVDYTERALFYWSRLYTSQLNKGDEFLKLRKTIAIHILDFTHFNEFDDYHSIFKVRFVNEPSKVIKSFDAFEMHFLELKKFKKGLKDLSPGLDKWMEFLKNATNYESESMPKELINQKGIKDAMQIFETITLSKKDQLIYDERMKQLWTERSVLEAAKIDAREEGREEGREEEKLKIAKSMKDAGIKPEEIAKFTGLSIDEVLKYID